MPNQTTDRRKSRTRDENHSSVSTAPYLRTAYSSHARITSKSPKETDLNPMAEPKIKIKTRDRDGNGEATLVPIGRKVQSLFCPFQPISGILDLASWSTNMEGEPIRHSRREHWRTPREARSRGDPLAHSLHPPDTIFRPETRTLPFSSSISDLIKLFSDPIPP